MDRAKIEVQAIGTWSCSVLNDGGVFLCTVDICFSSYWLMNKAAFGQFTGRI